MTTIYDKTQTISTLTIGLLDTVLITRDAGSGADPVVVEAGSISIAAGTTIEVSNGATLKVNNISAGLLSTILVDTGGTLEIGSGLGVQVLSSVTFGNGGGTLKIDQGANLSVLSAINGFAQGSTIDVAAFKDGAAFSAVYNPGIAGLGAGTDVTVFDSQGKNLGTIKLNGVDVTGNLSIAMDGKGGTNITFAAQVCFLTGTLIATPDGLRAVEDLQPGDLVLTASGAARPLVWVGSQTAQASSPDSQPVRIRAGAFADGMPQRDLLVTQEHCLFADGHLIPARMLVNGRSILRDTSLPTYTFHHLELETHDLLVAEGLVTESYLDTGNRKDFRQGVVHRLSASPARSWAQDAAAPLAVDRETVEPVWQRLADRAVQLGMPSQLAPAVLTDDAALRLLTDTGAVLRPMKQIDGRHFFLVPGGTRSLHLLSRTSRPADVVGPFVDDRRALGVLVGEIGVWRDTVRRDVQGHLGPVKLDGWLDAGSAAHRWTGGRALLPLSLADIAEITLVDIQICGGGPYLVEAETRVANAA